MHTGPLRLHAPHDWQCCMCACVPVFGYWLTRDVSGHDFRELLHRAFMTLLSEFAGVFVIQHFSGSTEAPSAGFPPINSSNLSGEKIKSFQRDAEMWQKLVGPRAEHTFRAEFFMA